jgi:hypothetical protein
MKERINGWMECGKMELKLPACDDGGEPNAPKIVFRFWQIRSLFLRHSDVNEGNNRHR